MRFWIFISVLMVSVNAVSQERVNLELHDAVSGEPLPFAHVCFENQESGRDKYVISDINGTLEASISGRTIIAVSSIGYATLIDTLYSGGTYEFELQPTIFDMEEVVVTAQLTPRKADNSIYEVDVINHLNIQQKAATNLSEVLTNKLNFRLTQDGVLGTGITMNGLGGQHVKILIDGVPVTGRMNGNIDLTQLNLNNVDHIEIVEGPMSVQYGSNALGGAINIITREGVRYPFSAYTTAYYESAGTYNFDGNISINKGKHTFSLSPGRNFFRGYPRIDGVRPSLYKPKEQYFADAFYMYSTSESKLKTEVRAFRETVLHKGKKNFPAYGLAFDRYFYTNRMTGRLLFNHEFSNRSKFEVSNSFSYYSREKNTFLNDLTRLEKVLVAETAQHDTSTFTNIISRATWSWSSLSEELGFQLGYDIDVEKGKGKRILEGQQDIGDYALFTVFSYTPFRSFDIQTGFRQAYNTKYKPPFVPSLNIKFTPVSRINLRASYVRGFRAPSLKELYLEFVDINHNILPSPDLEAEYSHNINLSADFSFDRAKHYFTIDGNGFINRIENSIQLSVVDPAQLIYGYVNVDGYSTTGGRLQFRYKLHPRFNADIGFSMTGHSYYEVVEGNKQTEEATSHEITSNLSYNLFRSELAISAFYKYSGKYPNISTLGDELSFYFIDPYHMLDFTVNKSFFRKTLTLSTGIKNLLDVTNVLSGGGSQGVHSGGGGGSIPVSWGRTWFVKLNYNFIKK